MFTIGADGSVRQVSPDLDPGVSNLLGNPQKVTTRHYFGEGLPIPLDQVTPEIRPYLPQNQPRNAISGALGRALIESGQMTNQALPWECPVLVFEEKRKHVVVPREWDYELIGSGPKWRDSRDLADIYVYEPEKAAGLQSRAAGLTFLLHIIPGGAARDYFSEEGIKSKEAWLAVAGDVAMFMSGGSTKLLRISAMSLEGGVITVRGFEMSESVDKGDYVGAAGNAGEILLRGFFAGRSLKGYGELPLASPKTKAGLKKFWNDQSGSLILGKDKPPKTPIRLIDEGPIGVNRKGKAVLPEDALKVDPSTGRSYIPDETLPSPIRGFPGIKRTKELVAPRATASPQIVKALRDAGLTRAERRAIFENAKGVIDIDAVSALKGGNNIALGPFSSGAVKPKGGKLLFPLSEAQSFDAFQQQAQALNARLLSDLPADISKITPEIRKADQILFFTKSNLTKDRLLTAQELRFILDNPKILEKTTFVSGFFP